MKRNSINRFLKFLSPCLLHIFMMIIVGLYTLLGAIAIRYFESKRIVHEEVQCNVQVEYGSITVSKLPIKLERNEPWSLTDSLIFCFTIITTIGYGNVTPTTSTGRLFVIIYGLVGIPLTMIVVANLGKFLLEVFKKLCQKALQLFKKFFKRHNTSLVSQMSDTTSYTVEFTLFITSILYIIVGSIILASYEPEMDIFKAIYFIFVTLTTIGLGDIVPKSEDYLVITLFYLTIGLALTTIAIEIAGVYLRKLHYFGRKIENVSNLNIWFGGNRLTMDQFIRNLGDQLNLDMNVVNQLDLDKFVEQAIKVEHGERPTLRNTNIEPIKPRISIDYHESVVEDIETGKLTTFEKGSESKTKLLLKPNMEDIDWNDNLTSPDEMIFVDEDKEVIVYDFSEKGEKPESKIRDSKMYNFV